MENNILGKLLLVNGTNKLPLKFYSEIRELLAYTGGLYIIVGWFEKYLRVRTSDRQLLLDGYSAKLMIMDELEYSNKTKFIPPTKHPLLTKVTPAIPKYISIRRPEVDILQNYINSKKHSKFCKTPLAYLT